MRSVAVAPHHQSQYKFAELPHILIIITAAFQLNSQGLLHFHGVYSHSRSITLASTIDSFQDEDRCRFLNPHG